MTGDITRLISVLTAVLCWHVIFPVQDVLAASKELNLDALDDPKVTPMPSMFILFFKLVVSLVVIVGLAYLTMKILRKNLQVTSKGETISVLDQYAFSLNKGIFITEIAGRVYVLGITDQNINLITEITDQDAISEMVAKAREREMEGIIPPSILERIWPDRFRTAVTANRSFKSHIREQIEKLQSVRENRGDSSREDERNV